MLCITRKTGERFILILEDGRRVVIRTEQKGAATKVAIDAPATVRVLREEVEARDKTA